ncbi:L30e-like protein [Thozetella sp. PMI_491]|nr:L30e-like protein [Thozetella sp. PMI_491]
MAATAEKHSAKDKSEKKSKKDKKEKKEKLLDDGVKKAKKDKKEKKDKTAKLVDAVERQLKEDNVNTDETFFDEKSNARDETLAPFAYPYAHGAMKGTIFDAIKHANKTTMIARGVKECRKVIKKYPFKAEVLKGGKEAPNVVVIIAADVAPMEVIMAIPMLCEEHAVPYMFVKSRIELGAAAGTKRATSIVALTTNAKKTPEADKAAEHDKTVKKYLKELAALASLAKEEYVKQVLPWVQGTHPEQITHAQHRYVNMTIAGITVPGRGRPIVTD